MGGSKRKKHYGVTINFSKVEHECFQTLTDEQKKIIRALVKTLVCNPELLSDSMYLYKLAVMKAISPYICPLCLAPFTSPLALKMHIRYAEHTTTCPVCKKQLSSVESTLDHVCKKHYICVS